MQHATYAIGTGLYAVRGSSQLAYDLENFMHRLALAYTDHMQSVTLGLCKAAVTSASPKGMQPEL